MRKSRLYHCDWCDQTCDERDGKFHTLGFKKCVTLDPPGIECGVWFKMCPTCHVDYDRVDKEGREQLKKMYALLDRAGVMHKSQYDRLKAIADKEGK